jgi:ribose transport system permease protein
LPLESPRRRLARGRSAYFLTQNVGLVLAGAILLGCILGYCGIFYASQARFPGGFEVSSTVNNSMPLAMVAIGQTIVVVTRGIDLSVGGIVDLANAIAAIAMRDTAASMVEWTIITLVIGAGLGLINGLLVGVGRLQPILVTLATLSIFQGAAIWILPQPGGSIPPIYSQVLANGNYPASLVYAVLAALFWYAFRRTALGVAIFAIGNDERAAAANGILVVRTKVFAYMLGGLFAAGGGLFLAATATAGDATTGNGYTLASIVAVVLGGVSLFGGRGSAIGSLLGSFVITVMVNILFFAHIDPLYQAFYEGLFLILAVVTSAGLGRYFRQKR